MKTIAAFLRRVFRRGPLTHFLPGFPPRKPAPRFEYLPESALPAEPAELLRAGVIRPWRLEGATAEQWFVAEIGAIAWYVKYLGGER